MNREIKFRVWNGEQMISPDYIDRKGFAHWKENSIPEKSDKVMQYTGLCDKFGKEIYEGDILEWCDEDLDELILRSVIYWNPLQAAFRETYNPNKNPMSNLTVSNSKIIGNIYENPELI